MLNAYWNRNGEEQAKYNELEQSGWLDDMITKDSANKFHRYYRYYNDGDLPGFARSRYELKEYDWRFNSWKLNSAGEQELENRVTEAILKEYKRFKAAQAKGWE